MVNSHIDFKKALKAVIMPSKLQILDTSIREPVTHILNKFEADNKVRIVEILYDRIQPDYICTQAFYNEDEAKSFGY